MVVVTVEQEVTRSIRSTASLFIYLSFRQKNCITLTFVSFMLRFVLIEMWWLVWHCKCFVIIQSDFIFIHFFTESSDKLHQILDFLVYEMNIKKRKKKKENTNNKKYILFSLEFINFFL